MRTLLTKAPSISSDNTLQLSCPTCWREMTQEQLRFTLGLIGSDLHDSVSLRTVMLLEFNGIKVLKRGRKGAHACSVKLEDGKTQYFDLYDWQVQDMIGQLGFVEKPEDMDVRLESIQGLKAIEKLLHGLPFIDYLNLEACYQGWLTTKKEHRIEAMGRIMYRTEDGSSPEGLTLDEAERANVLFWFFHVKKVMAKAFPHFFKPVNGNASGTYNHLEAFNAQLRALTGGDVTKEKEVKQMDCWRCLTELDAKAREAEEFNRKYGKNR